MKDLVMHDTVNRPLVTIGVASYNNAAYIIETLNSVRQQTYPRIELLIADDCSTDYSVTLIRQWLNENNDFDAKLFCNTVNRGVSAMANLLLNEAKGEYFSLLGSDDVYLPDKVLKQVGLFQQLTQDYAIIHSDMYVMDKSGKMDDTTQMRSLEPGFIAADGEVFNMLLQCNRISAPSVLLRTNAAREVGGYDEELVFEDWDMWMRLSRNYKVKFSEYISVKYRVLSTSVWNTRNYKFYISSIKALLKHSGINAETDNIVANQVAEYAQLLYSTGYNNVTKWLWFCLRKTRLPKTALLLLMSSLSVPYSYYEKFKLFYKK